MYLITEQQQKVFKKFLSTEDYKEVAKISGFSLSTVCNVLNRNTQIHKRSEVIVKALNRVTKKRIKETLEIIKESTELLEK